jgi:hypothetical protein
MTLSAPVWIVALALAACAPWVVRAIADRLEGRARIRTEALLARARAVTPAMPSVMTEGVTDAEVAHAGTHAK